MTELATYQGSALSADNLGHTSELAVKLSKSDLLPAHFKGKPENILLVLALAQNLNLNPVMCLQQVSVIGGKPCLQASLMLSLLNQSGKITGPIRFEWVGRPGQPDRGCIASATDAATGETVESEPVTLAMAQAEGWTRNPKYKSIPDTMLKWRAASFFVRTYYPEVVLGLHSAEELTDVEREERERPQSARDRLRTMREAQGTVRDVTPPQSEPEAPQEVPDDTQALVELLDAVANASDPVELTSLVSNAQAMEGQPRKAARIAIAERAKSLGLTWDADAGEFVIGKGGAA